MFEQQNTLEIPVDRESDAALAAPFATRIEICCDLDEHGYTPSPELVQDIRDRVGTDTELVALIRPHEDDDLTMTQSTLDDACWSLAQLAKAGASAAAFGVLDEAGALDVDSNLLLAEVCLANGLLPCLHRAFDFHPSLEEAVEIACKLGVARVLSAGYPGLDLAGVPLTPRLIRIAKAVDLAHGRFEVVAAGGVRSSNAHKFLDHTNHVHASCRMHGALDQNELKALRGTIAG